MISPVKIWRRQKTVRDLLGKKGTIVSWTTIYTPPAQFKHIAPYSIVFVKLDDNTHIVTQLVDFYETIKKGQRVVVVLRKFRIISPEDVIPYTVACKVL